MLWKFLFILSGFWFVASLRKLLFWFYLWQLKEYHAGRFFAHFHTAKGKRIFLNEKFVFKLLLFFVLGTQATLTLNPIYNIFSVGSIVVLLILYLLDTVKFLKGVLMGKTYRPSFTLKTLLLVVTGLMLITSFLGWVVLVSPNAIVTTLLLLSFDILTPLIATVVVFLFKPFVLLAKKRIIWKATRKRKKFESLFVIGITGSYGKSSTKEFLSSILSRKFNVLKTRENQNSEMGIAQCILDELNEDHEVFVCEMGAYNKGGIKLLCDIAQPHMGILTGINEQHLATFGSQQNTIEGKYELIESLPEDGLAIFNGSNKHCAKLYEQTEKDKLICGVSLALKNKEPDFLAQDVVVKKESIYFKGYSNKDIAEFNLNLLGRQNVENVLMAAAAAETLGISLEKIADICEEFKPKQGAMSLSKNKKGINIIDSTYSANPNGVIAHLDYLKEWDSIKVIVMPCLIELGEEAERIHREIGEKIGKVCNLAIITTQDYFKEMKKEAVGKGIPSSEFLFMKKPDRIYNKINEVCGEGDIVLLESRVPSKLIRELSVK